MDTMTSFWVSVIGPIGFVVHLVMIYLLNDFCTYR